MKTKHKILFAKIIFFFISKFKKKNIKIIKNKILWDLDLSEGIDLSIYIFGKFEFEIIKAIAKHKLSQKPVFFDIGANIGVQTLQLCDYFKNCTIHSFEPTNYAYNKLYNNVILNPKLKKRIILNQTFLTNKKKAIPKKIYSSWSLINKKNLHQKHLGSLKNTNNANTFRLDDYISKYKIKKIDFIKLDVDGYELEVLKSGYKFLKKNRTPIIFEVAPYLYKEHNYSKSDLVNLFVELKYSFYNINNLKKIKNIDKFISSISDGESTTLIAK
jgi:FkbM family methyltransferase